MNALTQYLTLYRDCRATIDAYAPDALNRRREAAFSRLESLGRLPERGDEGFEKVSVNDMFAPDFGINIARVPFGDDGRGGVHGCDIPNVGTYPVTVVNDAFRAPGLKLPDGLEVKSLAEALKENPALPDVSALDRGNPLVALNDLFVQDGVYIHVDAGVRVDRPVQILSLFNASQPLMAARRIVVHLERGASLSVIACDHPRTAEVDYLSCRTVDLLLGADSQLDFYDLEEATPRCSRASVTASAQEAGSRLNVMSVTLDGGVTRNEYYAAYRGDGCSTSLGGLVIAGGAQVVDNATFVTHDREHGTSDQLFKYVLFDSAQGAFEGLVTVAPHARFTDASQSNRNLLASPSARMHAMPQLIINCDDVKASHGSATGQLDSEALFYMRSRGIPLAEARMMLISAFMAEGLDWIHHEPLRQTLRMLLDRRLHGCSASCESCGIEPLRRRQV